MKKRDFITWTTSDQEAAIKFVRAHHPSVACIDLHMPKMNGIEVIKQMREIAPKIRVVVVSAFLSQFAKLLEPLNVRVVEKGSRTNQELEDVLCKIGLDTFLGLLILLDLEGRPRRNTKHLNSPKFITVHHT